MAASEAPLPVGAVVKRALRVPLVLAMLAGAAPFVAPRTASAQAMSNAALAETLYQEGKRLMAAKKYAEACPKFAESQRLDPGTGTLLNLAVCHQSAGLTATAWAEFSDAIASARRDGRADRAKFAEEQIAALEQNLSHVAIEVSPAARVPSLEVKLDGASIGPAAWGVATPIDPGVHEVVATAEGKTWSKRFEIRSDARDDQTVEVPLPGSTDSFPSMPAGTAESAPAAEGAGANAAGAQLAAAAPERPAPAHHRGLTGYVVGGAGVAALAAGSVFGLRAFSKWHARNDDCVDGVCNDAAVAAGDQAKTAARIADVAFAAGLIGVGVGAYLVISSGSSANSAGPTQAPQSGSLAIVPGVSSRGATLGLQGRW